MAHGKGRPKNKMFSLPLQQSNRKTVSENSNNDIDLVLTEECDKDNNDEVVVTK